MANHYETHLTLAMADADVLASIQTWAEKRSLKWTQIVLDSGKTPLQPMVTFWGSEFMEMQRQRAESLSRDIFKLGGTVVRIKIEAAIDNSEVPQTDSESSADSTNYFEHHVKVLLWAPSDLDNLSGPLADSNARLSRNSRRQRTDGRFERFVTQRVFRCGRVHAREKLDRLLKHLSAAAFQVLETEEEYVVFDSNVSADSGWLAPKTGD